MVNENFIPQTETVYKLKQEIPTYEEFMKNYKVDKVIENSYWLENQNQERGYGPCINCGSSSENFRFGYKTYNTSFGFTIEYSHIYINGENLREDLHNINSKSGRWATEFAGPFINRRITDFQASEGYRYAKRALEWHDKGYSINLKCWAKANSWGYEKSENDNMGNNWNWEF